jgi:hypothetical protein
MTALLFVLLSLDSLFASLVLGVFRVERARQMKLALAFGACDGTASYLGGALGPPGARISWLASHHFRLVVGMYLAAVVAAWLFRATKRIGSPLLWTVPVILSIDNLLTPAFAPMTLSSVILTALASASMSLIGFKLGTFLATIPGDMVSVKPFLRRPIS